MKHKTLFAATALMAAVMLASCGTTKKVANTPAEPTAKQDTVVSVVAEPEVLSVEEALAIFADHSKMTAAAKKYGYRLKKNYEVYRFDKFSEMYYKNCRLARVLTQGKYEDYPKPKRNGVSSYVAFKDGAMIIAVFNNRAYDNLVAQVKMAGFHLDMPGSEDIYTNGTRTIACFRAGKSIRIE